MAIKSTSTVTKTGLYYRIDSAGSSYLVSRDVSQSDTYMVTSIDVAPDGTIGIAHTNDTTYKTYFHTVQAHVLVHHHGLLNLFPMTLRAK